MGSSDTVLGPIAIAAGITLEALTVRWTFNNPAVRLPVLGATSVAQVRAWGAIACAPLPADVYAAVEAAVADLEAEVRAATGGDLRAYRGLA